MKVDRLLEEWQSLSPTDKNWLWNMITTDRSPSDLRYGLNKRFDGDVPEFLTDLLHCYEKGYPVDIVTVKNGTFSCLAIKPFESTLLKDIIIEAIESEPPYSFDIESFDATFSLDSRAKFADLIGRRYDQRVIMFIEPELDRSYSSLDVYELNKIQDDVIKAFDEKMGVGYGFGVDSLSKSPPKAPSMNSKVEK